jgi:glycerol-3-phosphate O-acyltransferase
VRENRRVLLDYYKNQAIHFFVSIGVTATLLEAATEGVVSLKDIEGRFVLIQDLFHHEFTFSRREPVGPHLRRLLEFLSRKEAVEVKGGEAHVPRDGAATRTLFSSLLRNFFEGYSIVWQSIPTLGRRPWEERELVGWLRHRGRILYLKGQVHQTESWSQFTLQNALAAFRDLGILSEERSALGRRPKRTFKVSSDAPRGEEMGALLLASLRQAGSAASGDHI